MKRKKKPTEHDEAINLIKAAGNKIKILPGDKIPANASFHICSAAPRPGVVNQETNCHECGKRIYFTDHRPTLKKLCIACVLKMAESSPVEAYGNAESIERIMNAEKRN